MNEVHIHPLFRYLPSNPLKRRLFLIFSDALLLPFSVFISFWLRLAEPFHPVFLSAVTWMLPAVILIGLLIYAFTGQYTGLTRYAGSESFYRLAVRNILLVFLFYFVGILLSFLCLLEVVGFLSLILLTGFIGCYRFLLRDILLSFLQVNEKSKVRVVIYGAGQAGAQLAAALRLTGNHKIVSFVDDNPLYWTRSINGIPIQPSQRLDTLRSEIDQALLAIPSLTRTKRRRIVDDLNERRIPVLQVPSVNDLTSGRARIDELRSVAIEDLLGRDPMSADIESLRSLIKSSVVCVTGAGGSIGSELCRQILQLHPSRLILVERSEPSLYSIERELLPLTPEGVDLKVFLGSSTNYHLMEKIFSEFSVDLVLHSSAYKHVPLVESNPLAGLTNNVVSTRIVCQAAAHVGVRKVILISTDKAVRPTNVMGASKRLAELVVQAWAQDSSSTIFSMVRFGNVLGSTGSVVPLFRRQILQGGPITLTHPEIIRYFMTIPEAAQLVLQASVYANGGEVFLLDMGDPVRIKDLAKQMIRLSGLSIRDSFNPTGDIEIVCTGLRPGEKLYEELLIDAESVQTDHPLIFKAVETAVDSNIFWPKLDSLQNLMYELDTEGSLSLLEDLVPDWQRYHPVS